MRSKQRDQSNDRILLATGKTVDAKSTSKLVSLLVAQSDEETNILEDLAAAVKKRDFDSASQLLRTLGYGANSTSASDITTSAEELLPPT